MKKWAGENLHKKREAYQRIHWLQSTTLSSFEFNAMAEEQDKIQDEKQNQETPELLKASRLEAIVKECLISPSQEEILQRIPHTNNHSPQFSHATTSGTQISARDFLTVGAHETIFYTPPDESQPQQNSDADEEEEESFDPKFESDRDQSLSLNTQCPLLTTSFTIFNPQNLQTPPKTKPQSALQLQEATSANSKSCNSTMPKDKPSICRRRLIGPSEEVKNSANSPSDLAAAETLNDTPQPDSEVNNGPLLDSEDLNKVDTQPFQSLGQIETSSKLEEADEKGQGQTWVETIRARKKIRARRTLPPFFSAPQRGISTSSCLERESSAPTFLERENSAPTSLDSKRQHKVAELKAYPETLMDVIMHCSGESPSSPCLERDLSAPIFLEKENSASKSLDPKRQQKVAVAKPYLETLMDVIIHCSGEPPVGYQDADVLEAAINAGITFPPPLSRHSFCLLEDLFFHFAGSTI